MYIYSNLLYNSIVSYIYMSNELMANWAMNLEDVETKCPYPQKNGAVSESF